LEHLGDQRNIIGFFRVFCCSIVVEIWLSRSGETKTSIELHAQRIENKQAICCFLTIFAEISENVIILK